MDWRSLPADQGDAARPQRRHGRHGAHRTSHRAAPGGIRRAGRLSQPQSAVRREIQALSQADRDGARRRHPDRDRAGWPGHCEHDQRRRAQGAGPERRAHQHGARLGGRRTGAHRGAEEQDDLFRRPRRLRQGTERAEGTDGDGPRGAVPASWLRQRGDAGSHGPACRRQHSRLGRRQAAADAGGGNAISTETRMIIRLGLIAVAVLAGSPALAQAPVLGDSAKGVIGSWEFSNADRDKICTATFKSDPTPVGFKVEFDKNCVNLFPIVASVAGWVFPDNDLLRLLDAQKKTLIEFSEVEDNIYEAPTPGLGVIFLQNAAAAEPAAKAPEQVAGDWTIVRANGAPLCQVSLGTTAAGDNLVLTVKPGCAASIAQLNFSQWRIDRGELMLIGERGNPWRFEVVDDVSWRRLPESVNSFMLVKQ